MKINFKNLLSIIVLFGILSCKQKSQKANSTFLEKAQHDLKNYDSIAQSKIMVVGTFHFQGNKEILNLENQENINKLIKVLSEFNPTKIVLEWEPSKLAETNKEYRSFKTGTFDISNKTNEVYQLGFRMAKIMKHDSIYLFDNQTEFIGSLDNFSFTSFSEYARQNDNGFYNKHEKTLIKTFDQNQKTLKKHNLYDRIAIMNSPAAQTINSTRMHMYEIRVGIQKNWLGPDWVSRWYQRNIRMTSNILKLAKKDDRILIFVGDNHKWILDMLFEKTPDLDVISSWEYLNKIH